MKNVTVWGHSLLTVKAEGDGKHRRLEGTATTPSVDRVGDIVDPMGVRVAKEIPLLLHHDHRLPVGIARLARPTEAGIRFSATLPNIEEEGSLRNRVNEAWQSVQTGLIRGISIGFRPDFDAIERLPAGGVLYRASEIVELSLVAIAANADCTVDSIKSLAKAVRRHGAPPPPRPMPVVWLDSAPAKRSAPADWQESIERRLQVLEMAGGVKVASSQKFINGLHDYLARAIRPIADRVKALEGRR